MPRHPSGKNPVSSQNRASYPPDVQDDAFIPVQQQLYEDEDTQFFEQNAFSAPYPDPVYSEDEQGDPTPV